MLLLIFLFVNMVSSASIVIFYHGLRMLWVTIYVVVQVFCFSVVICAE